MKLTLTKILVRYFISKLPNLEYEGTEEYEYSSEKRNEITENILNAGYNVLLQQSKDTLIIWIDKFRFQQR